MGFSEGMKKLAFLLLILIIIGGATYGVLQFMEIGPFAISEDEKAAQQKEQSEIDNPPVFIGAP